VTGDVQQLLDERAIREVLLRYCRGVDRLELDLVRECYHPDAIDDHGSFRGGVDEYLAWVGRLLPRYDMTLHLLGNILVEFAPDRPDVARVETYGVAIHEKAGGAPESNLTIGFRYLDRFERRQPVGWRIADRLCTTEWVRRTDPADIFPVDERFLRGLRGGRADPIFGPW
jgi:SnoaL-like protein